MLIKRDLTEKDLPLLALIDRTERIEACSNRVIVSTLASGVFLRKVNPASPTHESAGRDA